MNTLYYFLPSHTISFSPLWTGCKCIWFCEGANCEQWPFQFYCRLANQTTWDLVPASSQCLNFCKIRGTTCCNSFIKITWIPPEHTSSSILLSINIPYCFIRDSICNKFKRFHKVIKSQGSKASLKLN